MSSFTAEVIQLTAIDPTGDLACDTTIATADARDGLREDLARHIRKPVRDLADGVEVHFAPEGWDAVQRYVELESRCCGFLTLRLERTVDDVILTVTGLPDAKPWIDQIFA